MDAYMTEFLVGAVLPAIIDLLNRYFPNNRKLRFGISLLVTVIAGFIISFAELRYASPEQILESAVIVFTSAQSVYAFLYKGSKLQLNIR